MRKLCAGHVSDEALIFYKHKEIIQYSSKKTKLPQKCLHYKVDNEGKSRFFCRKQSPIRELFLSMLLIRLLEADNGRGYNLVGMILKLLKITSIKSNRNFTA